MSDPTLAVHKALLASLKAACTCEVYDGVPQDAAYPYVVMEYQSDDNENFLNDNFDRRMHYLTIWSRSNGQKEVLGIYREIKAINEQDMALDTGDLVSLRVEGLRTMRQNDNLTFKGQVTLRLYTTH